MSVMSYASAPAAQPLIGETIGRPSTAPRGAGRTGRR